MKVKIIKGQDSTARLCSFCNKRTLTHLLQPGLQRMCDECMQRDFCPDAQLRSLAELIHYANCHYSHTDQCSFAYDTDKRWKTPPSQDMLKAYRQAEKMVKNLDLPIETILRVLEALDAT